jgi:cytochrome o ubiquinol oxidase subunit III
MTSIPFPSAGADPRRVGHGRTGGHGHAATRSEGGSAPKRIIVAYGFWIFLLSDIVMFSALFAAYAVLSGATAGGPTGAQLFDLRNAGAETALLLASSFACGLAGIAVGMRNKLWFYVAMAATCLLGLSFLALELHFAGHARGRPVTKCLPVGVLYAGRMSRPSRFSWHPLAPDDDGSGFCKGFPGRH